MSLRVIQWATGSVGVAAIKGVLEHPELELAGCWVHSEAKSGKDVGEIIGTPPLGVTATNSIDDILALDADAVIYAPLLPNVDESRRCCAPARMSSPRSVGSIRVSGKPRRWRLPHRPATRRCTAPASVRVRQPSCFHCCSR
jgi:hypothetical protein